MTSQRDIFLQSEGDAWYLRNKSALESIQWAADPVCKKLASLAGIEKFNVLEVGCGSGARLAYAQQHLGCECTGIDPSSAAVEAAAADGIRAVVGTAEKLPFENKSFDVVIFGFCLYLCDDEDLFSIAAEADRVLRAPGWLIILDFDAQVPTYREYHHMKGVRSRKMDYKSMFLWHPGYLLASHERMDHESRSWTDDANNWIGVTTIRKIAGPSRA